MITVEYTKGTKQTDITPIVKNVEWSGDVMQAARKLQIALANTADGIKRMITIEEGGEIRFYHNSVELFRGFVFAQDITIKGENKIVAYDQNIYLTKNADTRKFNGKASGIIKRLCTDYGITMGDIVDTGYVIPRLVAKNKTLYDIMIMALTETTKNTGVKYHLVSLEGKLHLRERKHQSRRWVLENGTNILDTSYATSIEGTRNQVKVLSGDDKSPRIATVKNDALIASYGVMQHLEEADSKANQSQIQQIAQKLLDELGTVEDKGEVLSLGIPDVISGTAVYVSESMTGITGGYHVVEDTHTFEGNMYTMKVALSATDELPTLEMEEENKDDS